MLLPAVIFQWAVDLTTDSPGYAALCWQASRSANMTMERALAMIAELQHLQDARQEQQEQQRQGAVPQHEHAVFSAPAAAAAAAHARAAATAVNDAANARAAVRNDASAVPDDASLALNGMREGHKNTRGVEDLRCDWRTALRYVAGPERHAAGGGTSPTNKGNGIVHAAGNGQTQWQRASAGVETNSTGARHCDGSTYIVCLLLLHRGWLEAGR